MRMRQGGVASPDHSRAMKLKGKRWAGIIEHMAETCLAMSVPVILEKYSKLRD